MTNIEQLKKETNEITDSLKKLKENVSLSDTDKKTQAEALKTQAEKAKQKIQSEIDALKDKTDGESKKKKEEAEALLNSFTEITNLYSSILNSTESRSKEETSEEDKQDDTKEEKWFFWKVWDWLWNMWNNVTTWDKWKEQPWKNLLYLGWTVVTWFALYKWVKSLWNWAFWDKKKEDWKSESSSKESDSKKKDDEKSFWDWTVWKTIKTVWSVLAVWSVWYYVAHGLYTKNRWMKDLWDREKGKKLEFDAALEYCKWAIANQDNKEGMSYGMDLKYHEDTWEIEAYWERVKIDKNKRKIEWLDVDFKKYEHMINTAIVIAYLKKTYSWKCKNNNPFHLNWNWQWDVNVNTVNGDKEGLDWTGNAWRIVWVTAGWLAGIVSWIFGWLKIWTAVWVSGWIVWYMAGSAYDHDNIMNDHMPELDNEYWKKSLWAYLNAMKCWQAKNQIEDDITDSPIKKEIVEVMNNIQDTNQDLAPRWASRQLDAIPDPNDEKQYIIKAYGRDFSAEVTWDEWNRKIRILGINGWNPEIKTDTEKSGISNIEMPLKEWCYMSCFIWYILDNFHHKWISYPRFSYKSRSGVWIRKGIYLDDARTRSTDFDTRVLSKDKFKDRMPTLFQEENRKKFLEFLNNWILDWATNISIWKKMD